MQMAWEDTKMSKVLPLVTAGLLFGSISALGQDTALNNSMAAKGERTYKTYCGACHGKMAKGDGPLAKDLKVTPADLTQLISKNNGAFPFEMVTKTIEGGRNVRGHGTEDMPAWGPAFKTTADSPAAAKEMIRELAHYLWSMQPK
jgi:mono/diheme cytochrome c family protein